MAALFPGCGLERVKPPQGLQDPGPAHPSTRRELYLNIAVVIEQYIFQLQVPVDHTVLKWEDKEGIEWERLGWEQERKRKKEGAQREMSDRLKKCASPVVFASILQAALTVLTLPRQRPTSDSRALVTCCVVKGKMTGICFPPEPVKQQGDSLSECDSTVWKQYNPRQRQTMSVWDGIPREEADFSAGDSRLVGLTGTPRLSVGLSVCVPACLPNAGKTSGSIYCDPFWSVLRITFPKQPGEKTQKVPLCSAGLRAGWKVKRERRPVRPGPLAWPKQVAAVLPDLSIQANSGKTGGWTSMTSSQPAEMWKAVISQ